MANVVQTGFRYAFSLSGGVGKPMTMVQEVANNYGTQISVGDPIIPVSDGTVAVAAANSTTLLGVVVGCSYMLQGRRVTSNFIPASTTFTPTTVGSVQASLVEYIPFTPDAVFKISGAAATFTTLANQVGVIGENCNIITFVAGDTTTGVSKITLDVSTHATTAAQFRIIGIDGYTLESGIAGTLLDQDVTALGFDYLVTCNQGVLPPYTTTGV